MLRTELPPVGGVMRSGPTLLIAPSNRVIRKRFLVRRILEVVFFGVVSVALAQQVGGYNGMCVI